VEQEIVMAVALYDEVHEAVPNRFKITVGLTSVDSKVEMNGVEIKGVTRVHFDMTGETIGHVKLEIIGEVVVEGEYVERRIAGTE
jgi:hypothetical protein